MALGVAFLEYFWRRFRESHCTDNAAALSYTTLLALVPLLALSLGIFAAFPAFQETSNQLLNLVFEHLVPAAQETIQEYVRTFADQAKKLTGLGILFLVLTALMLMITIETSLNEIWRAPPYRALHRRLLVYWAVLTLGPLLMGAGIAITSRWIASAHLATDTEPQGLGLIFRFIPFLLENAAFTLLYQLVPNARVKLKLAAWGGFLSAALFEAAKSGFAFYITRFPTYEAVYGAFAAAPIFLVWLYLSWLVTLIGAQFTYCLHAFRYVAPQIGPKAPEHDLVLAYTVLKWIFQGQQADQLLDEAELARRLPELSPVDLDKVLGVLRRNGWIARGEENRWLLRRDLHLCTLLELYRSHAYVLPPAYAAGPLKPWLAPVEESLNQSLNVTLAQLFAADEDSCRQASSASKRLTGAGSAS
nr:ribonuclease BN [uncultured Gammaproteobacteria bacterium]